MGRAIVPTAVAGSQAGFAGISHIYPLYGLGFFSFGLGLFEFLAPLLARLQVILDAIERMLQCEGVLLVLLPLRIMSCCKF